MSLVVDRDTGGIYCKYCGNGVRLHDGGYHYKTKYKVGEVVAVAQNYFSTYDESKWENGIWYNEFADGNPIVEYKSIMDAVRQIGVNKGNIVECLKGRRKTAGGYIWTYK
jgi:hypothetical protein